MYTINLCDVGKDKIALAGGRGANLGEKIRPNSPVPWGFSITSSITALVFKATILIA